VHVDEAITTVGVPATEQNRVSVPHDSDVGKAPVFIRIRNRELAQRSSGGIGETGWDLVEWWFMACVFQTFESANPTAQVSV